MNYLIYGLNRWIQRMFLYALILGLAGLILGALGLWVAGQFQVSYSFPKVANPVLHDSIKG